MRPGLLPRLLLGFVLVGVVSTMATAGASYIQARNVVLRNAQDPAVTSLVQRVRSIADSVTLPPDQAGLDELDRVLTGSGDPVLVEYDGQFSSHSGLRPEDLPAELKAAVRDGTSVVWQRQVRFKQPYLVIGMPVLIGDRGQEHQSGLRVYSVRSLAAEQVSINRLATTAWLTAIPGLVLAVLLAFLIARRVLRPVRELGAAARRWGAGDLGTRLDVRGADELADLTRTFNATADALEHHVGELRRMEADSRRFVADVSHELRTPLAAMTAVTDVLDEEAEHLTGDAASAARLVSQETRRLNQLVTDLIEVSRFDSGTAGLSTADVDAAAAVRGALRDRGWTEAVETDLPDGIRCTVDPRRLGVIVANLVSNALAHGGPPVRLQLRAAGGWLSLSVADQGPGLAPEVLPHVFDRFYKADVARTRSEGSGLGLAIAQENAKLHGGRIEAANAPDGGAVFTLWLPRDTG
ncbi:sensor histidine kinase [Longispora albida]|uniref:sensor histidine kinase n=1 Tax=Longispora albida TaxID=203523 RepID=UPI000368C341|nr:HAMP domain-containing sensor histidine kinase [Longispora albida]